MVKDRDCLFKVFPGKLHKFFIGMNLPVRTAKASRQYSDLIWQHIFSAVRHDTEISCHDLPRFFIGRIYLYCNFIFLPIKNWKKFNIEMIHRSEALDLRPGRIGHRKGGSGFPSLDNFQLQTVYRTDDLRLLICKSTLSQ